MCLFMNHIPEWYLFILQICSWNVRLVCNSCFCCISSLQYCRYPDILHRTVRYRSQWRPLPLHCVHFSSLHISYPEHDSELHCTDTCRAIVPEKVPECDINWTNWQSEITDHWLDGIHQNVGLSGRSKQSGFFLLLLLLHLLSRKTNLCHAFQH